MGPRGNRSYDCECCVAKAGTNMKSEHTPGNGAGAATDQNDRRAGRRNTRGDRRAGGLCQIAWKAAAPARITANERKNATGAIHALNAPSRIAMLATVRSGCWLESGCGSHERDFGAKEAAAKDDADMNRYRGFG